MKTLETFIGLLVLLAGSYGVYYLFHERPAPEEQQEQTQVATVVSVQTGTIHKTTLQGYVRAYGTVELQRPDVNTASAEVTITAPISGIVAETHCGEGQTVTKGEILFRLDSRLAGIAVEKARQAVKFAQKEFDRQQKLRKVQGTSDKQFQASLQKLEAAHNQLELAELQREYLDIKAPISGIITKVSAVAGEAINSTQPLAELHDIHRLIVSARVPSGEAKLLSLGQKVEIVPDYKTGFNSTDKIITGTVDYLDTQIDSHNDTVGLRVVLPRDTGLLPGKFVKIRIVYVVHPDCLVIPEEGIVATSTNKAYIAVVEGDTAYRKLVQTGLHERGLVEIAGAGIHEGMSVVTVGTYGLPEKTRIRVAGK